MLFRPCAYLFETNFHATQAREIQNQSMIGMLFSACLKSTIAMSWRITLVSILPIPEYIKAAQELGGSSNLT